SESPRAFYLDQTIGMEHVFAVLSATKWFQLEEALEKETGAAPSPELAKSIFTMLDRIGSEPDGRKLRGVGGTHEVQLGPMELIIGTDRHKAGQTKRIQYEAADSSAAVGRWFRHLVNPQ